MTPEHLVDSAKLYDYYVNGFSDGNLSRHTARVHLSTIEESTAQPLVHSAPSLVDLLNAENVEPQDVDTNLIEEHLFNHPDPYDLAEVERVDDALQQVVFRSSSRFDIADFIKLDDAKLKGLIMNVDAAGPGALLAKTDNVTTNTKAGGKPGDWNVASFID